MKIETIYKEWEKDGQINLDDLSHEIVQISKLHNKYYSFLVAESIALNRLRHDLKRLTEVKKDYYMGHLAQEELDENGWHPFEEEVSKTEIPGRINRDEDLIDLSLKIGVQEAKVEYLESIVRQVSNRGFQIKNLVDLRKLQEGVI